MNGESALILRDTQDGFAIFQLFPSTLLGLFDASETMLAIGDPQLREALAAYKQEMAETVAAKDAKLQADL